MKKFLTAMAILACTGTLALAGPNAGGTIFVHFTPGIGVPADPIFVDGGLAACDQAIATAPADEPILWYAYAAFPSASSPRLKVITFGCNFDMNYVGILWSATVPGATEITFDGAFGWPYPGSGKTVGFQETLTGTLSEFYTFAGYGPSGYTFDLVPHPDPNLGGSFADDGSPSVLDAITCYGNLGFGTGGAACCPREPLPGACCYPDGHCEFVLEINCGGVFQGEEVECLPETCPQPVTGACCLPDGTCQVLTPDECHAIPQAQYMGDDVPCTPDLCPTPTERSSWGQIKNNYR